jgi:hypothetical protein
MVQGIMLHPAFNGVSMIGVGLRTPSGSGDRALAPWVLRSILAVRRRG